MVVDIYDVEQQCLYSDGRSTDLRHGGCFPVEDFIDGFGFNLRAIAIFNPRR
ncbi:DUF1482 family protein [Salmonella enterica subsp. enterica]|nr:DUF1482 family protein [Salmonella enterica subsp. enterica]